MELGTGPQIQISIWGRVEISTAVYQHPSCTITDVGHCWTDPQTLLLGFLPSLWCCRESLFIKIYELNLTSCLKEDSLNKQFSEHTVRLDGTLSSRWNGGQWVIRSSYCPFFHLLPGAMFELGVGFTQPALQLRLPSVLGKVKREFLATHSLGTTKPNSHPASPGVDGTRLLLPTWAQ